MASFSRESTGVEIVKHLEREVEDKTSQPSPDSLCSV